MSLRSAAAALLLLTLTASSAQAAEVIIINNDPAGEGLNDPTPASPVAGNPGTTLGELRVNVLQRAAEIWAQNLESAVPITILAQTARQACSPTSAVLASAGANVIFQNFPNAPLADTWYHGALANSLAGEDLDEDEADIFTQFNLNLDDQPDCLGGNGWYYGYDHNEELTGQSDLLAVMLHEYGHGLGFANFANESSGTLFDNTPDVYTTFTRDLETGKDWNDMSNTERQASAVNDPDVVWTGPTVAGVIEDFLDPLNILIVNSPAAIAGTYSTQPAQFGPPVPEMGLTANVALVNDGTAPDNNDGCEAVVNTAAVNGKIALIQRGNCTFVQKVQNAEAAGAVGVMIFNNEADGLPPMGGTDPTGIPSIGILQSTGQAILGELPGVNATLGYDPVERAGANGGFLRVNAPNPVQPGSSISHWTPAATPSLLMEPSITPDLTDDVDLTLEHFTDIGWVLTLAEEIFANGFEEGDTTAWSSTIP